MKVVLLDNHDSFTYNLLQLLEQIVGKNAVTVIKNDETTWQELAKFDKIILSPGPGIPSEAGILLEVVKNWAGKKSIFGVCLGLQAITEAFGGSIENLEKIFHGVGTELDILLEDSKLFQNIPNKTQVGRYHSWAAKKENFPQVLDITATDEDGIIMALQHKNWDIHAVQFHPESILTPLGKLMLENFLK